MKLLVCLLLAQFLVDSPVNAQQQGTYKAAVVEYPPNLQSSDPTTRILANVFEYTDLIEQAANKFAQIIVFPEDGLTGWQNISFETVESYSTHVPDPLEQISPCMNKHENYSKFFQDLSCAAQTHKIYTVVNLIERRHDNNTNKKIYHNTNVVFDKNGVVVARYRKMNLLNEPVFTPGTGPVSFKTDFGVTFGMFVCWDINFKNSALDVLLDPAVTDVVFSAAWFSHLPFYGALSVQHAYAKANGVNLLASGLDDPAQRNGGSGIYLADGTILETYIRGARSTKLIIQDVPRINAKAPAGDCQLIIAPTPRLFGIGGGQMPDIGDFATDNENLSNYTSKALHLDNQTIKETVCSGKFCCSFDISVTTNPNVKLNYVYKMIAFHGASQIGLTGTLGLSNCALVACLNNDITSCGKRLPQGPSGVSFSSISVKGNFNINTSTTPITLKHDLLPITEYKYCKKPSANEVEIEITTSQQQDSILTFGLYGRDFENDDKPVGQINSATFLLTNVHTVFIISIIIFLLQD